MTRDRKTVSAVFMAVLLVIASGTAVSLAVTDSGNTALDSNAAVQDETTTEANETTAEVGDDDEEAGDEDEAEVGDENDTDVDDGDTDLNDSDTDADDGETDADDGDTGADDGDTDADDGDTDADDGETDAQATSVTISEQESDGEQVVVESVTLEESGFVVIHDESLQEDDAIGSVVGVSRYLEAGSYEELTITLGRSIDDTQTVTAMPHQDTNDNQAFDFIISDGQVDGAFTADGDAVTDQATVTVDGAAEEAPEETPDETVVEETPEETPDETVVEETPEETPDETVVEETPEETPEETVVEEPEETPDEIGEPVGEQQLVFQVEQMNIDRWSFVVGDEQEPDRTETVSDITVQDRRVEINLTELMQEQAEQQDQLTTPGPEAQEELEENLSGDIETVRFVIENVNVENVTFVVTAPEDMELPEQPDEMGPETTDEQDGLDESPEDTVIEDTEDDEADLNETPEETVVEETPEETPEDTVIEETPNETVVEETPEETEIEETPEETEIEETPEETEIEDAPNETEVEETTDADAELESFDVSAINAPENAQVGDTVNVSAVVTNPNDEEATQDVAFRLEGTVIARNSVTLNGSSSTTVAFEVDTSDVPPGEYVHGVYTRDFGELAVITLEDPTAEDGAEETAEETEVDDADGDTDGDADEETPTPAATVTPDEEDEEEQQDQELTETETTVVEGDEEDDAQD